ncbi:hypothetical protein [Priestia megaterium]|uniref:hypothetical protein n=1 Tax=Priestia megaterium TaxID=1404 RepID=UPI0013752DF6|nr:hypothetical protein [Priestia megaterium]
MIKKKFHVLKCGNDYLRFKHLGGGLITLTNSPFEAYQFDTQDDANMANQAIFTNISDYEFSDPAIKLENVFVVEVIVEENKL